MLILISYHLFLGIIFSSVFHAKVLDNDKRDNVHNSFYLILISYLSGIAIWPLMFMYCITQLKTGL